MNDYVVQEMARQHIEDLHREASIHRIARLARGRKRGPSKPLKRHRARLKEATAPK
jgi:hypothetical protein